MEEMNLQKFGKRLKELREYKKLSARQLAKAIDTSNAIIILWENAKTMPSAGSIFKLAQFFGVRSDYLIGLED